MFLVVYQLGLVEREIAEVVYGKSTVNNSTKKINDDTGSNCREKLCKKEITEDDICPICQEDLLGVTEATTYCK